MVTGAADNYVKFKFLCPSASQFCLRQTDIYTDKHVHELEGPKTRYEFEQRENIHIHGTYLYSF